MRYIVFLGVLFFTFSVSAVEVDDAWLALVHYQNRMSSIDTENFFLSKNGKNNPEEELQETIELFSKKDNADIKCLFPARYLYLQKKGLVKEKFPKCEEYEQFKNDLQAKDITLLFTDAYMNNPSSMFGHTLLRIDTKRKGTQMLAHGINYGAFTGEEGGALYALKGLLGFYWGGLTVKPYYDVINAYNNIENRDIWELTLDFDAKEREFAVAHLWEIGQVMSRYYFFSRNCSYMLMEIIDAVRPELKLAKKFENHVIPLDSFKAVANQKGLVKDINYRPSRQNKIKYRYKMMSDKQRKIYKKAIKSGDYNLGDELNDAQKADVWETAYQFVQYQWVAKKLELQDYRKQSFDILRARSVYKNKSSIAELEKGKSPLLSHKSKRLVVGVGEKNKDVFEKIELRPAYQSLTDNDYGLIRGAQINFLNSDWRYYNKYNKLVLQEFDVLNIRSISPIDAMFHPVSFQLDINVERWQNPITENEHYVGNFMIGGGGAFDVGDYLRIFAFVNNRLGYAGGIPHNSYGALGVDVGALLSLGNWRGLLEVEPQIATQNLFNRISYKSEINYIISKDWAIGLSGNFIDTKGKNNQEYTLGLRWYF